MAGKPFDATMKDLIEADAASWAALASSIPPTSVRFEDADVSSVTAAADKVLRVVDATGEWLLDLEPQSSHAGDAPDALHLYSTLLQHRHGLRVRSVLLLLRPEANATSATGLLERRHPDEEVPYTRTPLPRGTIMAGAGRTLSDGRAGHAAAGGADRRGEGPPARRGG